MKQSEFMPSQAAGQADGKKISRRSLVLKFKIPKRLHRLAKRLPRIPARFAWLTVVAVLVFVEFMLVAEPLIATKAYSLDQAASVLGAPSQSMAEKIHYDPREQAYSFNGNYMPGSDTQATEGGPKISALAYSDPTKGVMVTDPFSEADFGLKPKFGLKPAEQQQNRIVYPLADGTGWLVYTMHANQVKEDVLLRYSNGDSMALKYELNMGNNLAARLLDNGDVGIYGSSLPVNGNITTSNDKDAKLLEKARKKAPKDKLLFVIPAPVINEHDRTKSSVQAHYELENKELTVKVSGLKKANYPLSIDPSVYVTSAQQFMRGNNESNVDFDTSNDLIQKSKLTGARISGWSSDLALNASRWSAGYASGGGYAYVVGGASGGTNQNNVYWAQFNPSSTSLRTPPNPGTGASGCNSSNWCTNTAYNLPASRSGLSSVVYNGYIYAIGGTDSSCAGTNNVCSTVYVSKIGANGEPIGWSATSSLVTGRRLTGAVAYNNKLYVVGGQTNASLNGEQTVEAADIKPDGTLGAWSTTGMTSIPTAGRWGATLLQNNGYLYIVGGSSTTTTASSVQYIKINSDGTLASSWVTTSSFTNARAAFGGNFATIYGGYMYITSGCATLTTTSCTTLTSTTNDFQLASINGDGSITGFSKVNTNLSSAMTGYGFMAWRGGLYAVGGCTAVSTATNCSGTTQTAVYQGPINSDGDVSAVFPSPASSLYASAGSPSPAPLSDLPAAGNGAGQVGRLAAVVVVNNGYIYNIGGCANVGCTTMSDNTAYAAINSDGTLGSWTVDSTNTINGTTGIAAAGAAVYNNNIYVVGGADGAAHTRSVFRVALSTTGALSGAWTATTNILPSAYAYTYSFARAVPNVGTSGYLYMIGGCTGTSGIACSGYVSTVQRCTIASTGGAPASCTTTGQLQLDTATGLFGGTIYGNYIYLAGGANSLTGSNTHSATGTTCTADPGVCGDQTSLVQYAMVNSSGNITRTDGTTVTGGWHAADGRLNRVRRRSITTGVNGYLYVIAGHDATSGNTSTLSDIQRGKIDPDTGSISSFTTLATSISPRWDLGSAQANGYIYLLGGCTTGDPPTSCSAINGTNEYVQVYNNWSGTPTTYTSSANRPLDRYGGASTLMNGYLYLAGGCVQNGAGDCTTTNGVTVTTDVTYAQLNPDGSIGTWTTAANVLPAVRSWGRLENVGGTLYYLGGQQGGGGNPRSDVYYSTPSGAAPGVWGTATNVLPAARSIIGSAVYNNRIYITGGNSNGTANGAPQTSVYYSPDLSAGGNITSAWSTNATSFTLGRSGHQTVAYGNNLYVIGGYDGTNYLLDAQYAPINSDGSVGTWKFTTSLPQFTRQGDAVAANGFLYVFGGRSAAGTCTNNTYVAPFNADGSLGSWSQTSVKYNAARFGHTVAYDNGRLYLLGGGCGASVALTGTDNAIYSTVQLQPQLANYSLLIDTDTDIFPNKYVINGLDNFGAAWFLKYISSTNAAATWGQSTNAGRVTLGTPGTYTPKNAAGTNTNFSRYHMLFLTIDDQQDFGFPEDVSRGPNIYDITLQFSSDPGKRLRNGKTFTGGVQQPLDTPF